MILFGLTFLGKTTGNINCVNNLQDQEPLMTDLTKEELQEKITQVKRDIANHNDSSNLRMLLGLNDYVDYLEDELKTLTNKQ